MAIPRRSLVKLQPVTPVAPPVGAGETLTFVMYSAQPAGTVFRVDVGGAYAATHSIWHRDDIVGFDLPAGVNPGTAQAVLEMLSNGQWVQVQTNALAAA